MISKLDTTLVKQNIDLRELAGRFTELPTNGNEVFGPCPRCGGDDRFHCTADWFFCRQCHPQRGDAIEFIEWLENCSFKDAVARLDGNLPIIAQPAQPRPATHRKLTTQPPTFNIAKQTAIVEAAHNRLMAGDNPGAACLQGRGLHPATWLRFKLGYRPDVPLPGTWDAEQRQATQPPQPAIVIPWFRAGALCGVRYRFLQTHTYTTSNEKRQTAKQTAATGSRWNGVFYGGLGLLGCAEQMRTLLLCEGELNALSIWQVAHETGLDVLSIGSESAPFTDAMIDYAKQFEHVIAWMDREEVAQRVGKLLPGAHLVKSPGGKDANDLLRSGLLGGFIAEHRRRVVNSDYQREKLLWDLYDAHHIEPLDDGALQVMHSLADELHKVISI